MCQNDTFLSKIIKIVSWLPFFLEFSIHNVLEIRFFSIFHIKKVFIIETESYLGHFLIIFPRVHRILN